MTPDTSIVERMYGALVEEIGRTRPELLKGSFTVAEIYQNLVPYRTHRDRIGADMNGDYEHALLRLLAGEGGWVELDSGAARRRLQEELKAIDPDTGIYRNFAACEVRLNSERLEGDGTPTGSGEGMDEEASDEEVEGEPWLAEMEGDAAVDTDPAGAEGPPSDFIGPAPELDPAIPAGEDEPPAASGQGLGAAVGSTGTNGSGTGEGAASPAREEEAGGLDGEDGAADESCRWCRERLPERGDLRFCPYCGSRADLRPCPECSAELESDWIFCVACGAEAGD